MICAEDGLGTSNNNKAIATTQTNLRYHTFANRASFMTLSLFFAKIISGF
jgi:hypothetical protein